MRVEDIHYENQALMAAAEALRDRDTDQLEAIIARVQDWLGDHAGMLAALQEMHDAAFELAEMGV